jgi:hypothetical protein
VFFALAMIVVVLFVGFKLGGGFDRAEPAASVASTVQSASQEFVQAPRPREVIREAAPAPNAGSSGASAPARRGAAPPSGGTAAPLGRWEGVLGGRHTVVVLAGTPSAFKGSVTSSFLSKSMKLSVSGSYDPGSRLLSFEDLEPVPDAGRYWGTVSADGTKFEGFFELLDGQRRVPLLLQHKG